MTDRVRTCLWFDDRAEDAADFYTSLLPDSHIDSVVRPAPDAPPLLIHFTLGGVPYTLLQAGPGAKHSYATSISVVLDTQARADALYDKILQAGGAEVECGWLTDAWGISWQVVPDGVEAALLGGDAAANQRAYAALRGMKRVDLAQLRAAAKAST